MELEFWDSRRPEYAVARVSVSVECGTARHSTARKVLLVAGPVATRALSVPVHDAPFHPLFVFEFEERHAQAWHRYGPNRGSRQAMSQ